MVAPGFLQNPEVRRWLNGVEPAWTMLDFDSFNALLDELSASNDAIRLEANLPDLELSGSAIVANALLLLRRAADSNGLKLTATGNLSRAVVEEMCGIMEWPGYDKDELFGFHKVINEPDFLPLHFIRILTQAAKLIRTYRGKLVTTPVGRKILNREQHGPLQAVLFHVAFWRLNLGYFDRYAVDRWPQKDDGLDNQNRRKTNREPGISARFFLLLVAFIALDDSVPLDSDFGVQFSSLVIATPLLKDLILLSERGQDVAKLADLLADQARHLFFAVFAPSFLIPVQRVECKQDPRFAVAQASIEYHFVSLSR